MLPSRGDSGAITGRRPGGEHQEQDLVGGDGDISSRWPGVHQWRSAR